MYVVGHERKNEGQLRSALGPTKNGFETKIASIY